MCSASCRRWSMLAENFHTKVITTSPKVKIKGATHIEFNEHRALEHRQTDPAVAIDNFPNRGKVHIPQVTRGPWCRVSPTNTSTTCWAVATAPRSAPQRRHHGRSYPRRGRHRRLQQPSQQARTDNHTCTSPRACSRTGCPGGGDRLRRFGQRQVGPAAGRGRAGKVGPRAARGVRGHRHPAGVAHGVVRG
jgi:hypothetical protein